MARRYDFQCKKCLHVFEKWLDFSKLDKAQRCPNCRSIRTRRHYRVAPSIRFNGGGFYINDKDKK